MVIFNSYVKLPEGNQLYPAITSYLSHHHRSHLDLRFQDVQQHPEPARARYHVPYRLENAWYLKEKMVKHWEYIGETPTPILLCTHPCLSFSRAYVFVRHVPFRDASEMRLSMAHVM